MFAILSDGQRVILAEADSSHQVRIVSESRGARSFYSYPTGRILAAYASASDLARIIECNGMPGAAWDGIATQEGLAQALAELRRDGFCALEESSSQVLGLAVPTVDSDGTLLGALGLHAPAFRCPTGRRNEILRALRTAAAELAEKL